QSTHPNIELTKVVSAEEMYKASVGVFAETEITVLSAAVADYKPITKADQKIKKASDQLTIELTKTHDIAAQLGSQKRNGQVMVGFALETENERANALKKLNTKNLDFIVLNSLNDAGAGFGYDTNKISIISKTGEEQKFSLKSKKEVAKDIVDIIVKAVSHD
ncbi:MAG: phosphopantothenoylcysteine decarboxylase, partial [Cytophagales bacterium]